MVHETHSLTSSVSPLSQLSDLDKTFAICPHGLLEEEAQALEKANRDFRAIAPDHRVTLYWLEVKIPCSVTITG